MKKMEFQDQLLQWLVTGLTTGAIYALLALGFVAIYNVTGIINFAQGESAMLGALVMVSLPIADWSTGWSVMTGPISAGVSVTAGLVVALLWAAWGPITTMRVAVLVLVLSWAAEAMGSRIGIPFGMYRYTTSLQPQILGVPWQIPLGWLMMMPPSWAVAQAIVDYKKPRRVLPVFVGLSAMAMTFWDLFLDPLMVTWGMWVWTFPGGFLGIPWANFIGWMLVSGLITILIRPRKLPVGPLLIIYTAIWLLKTVGLGFFWGIHGAAVAGGILMGIITSMAWRELIRGD